MASTSDPPRGSWGGELATTNAAQVLRQLETKRASARVTFETEIGRGEVDVVAGEIVDAHLGELFAKPALFALLGVSEGHFSVSEVPNAEPRPAICQGIEHLLAERSRRMSEWRELSAQMPSLTASLSLSPAGEEKLRGAGSDGLRAEERKLARLLDGRRTIGDLVSESGVDAVEALKILLAWRSDGLVNTGAAVSAPPPPKPEPAAFGASLRRTTVIGMGLPPPEPVQPRRAEVRRSISVGPAPQPSAPPPEAAPVGPPGPQSGPTHTAPLEQPNAAPAPAAAAAVVPPSTGSPGVRRTVGRYEVLCRIGHGGMGSVYLCRVVSETGFRRLFALKLLRQHLLDDVVEAERFLEEAKLAGHLHHPNVVSVVDAGLEGTQPYLVMDYIEGGSLKQLLSAHPTTRPPQLILPIILDALSGLHSAHTLVGEDGTPLDIVHCDVSPENLLVGVDGVCRLTDFGVARRGSGRLARGELTHGKLGYLAPEQIRGGYVDRRTDIFALGVVLYNALTATKLFEATTLEESLRLVSARAIQPPSQVGLRPPHALDAVCMKALEYDPFRRYATAEEMLLELRTVALRENLLAAPAAIAAWVRESVGRELDQRRLIVLDANRNPNAKAQSMVPGPGVPQQAASFAPGGSFDAASTFVMSDGGDGSSGEEPTGTIPIDTATGARRWFLIAAAVLAVSTVFVTLIWPSQVSRFFRINTQGARAEGIEIEFDGGTHQLHSEPDGSTRASTLDGGSIDFKLDAGTP